MMAKICIILILLCLGCEHQSATPILDSLGITPAYSTPAYPLYSEPYQNPHDSYFRQLLMLDMRQQEQFDQLRREMEFGRQQQWIQQQEQNALLLMGLE